MSNLRTSISLDLAGNLAASAKRYGDAMASMSQRGSRAFAGLRSAAASAGRGLDALGNRYTALITGAAGAGTARMVMGLQTRFTRLGIQASASAAQMDELKRSIYETAQMSDIRVDPGEITSAIEAIVEKTGDLKFAEENVRNIGVAIQAAGAAGASIGELFAEFQKMGIASSREVLEAFDTLNEQGKMGAFTMQNLAALGPRVITAYTATGRTGAQALREMGAALQMIRMGTGSSEQAATAFEAVMRTMTDPRKLKDLARLGVKVWGDDDILRPVNEIMEEVIKKADGPTRALAKIFDAEAIRAFNQAAGEFKRTGSLDNLQKFMEVQGDGTTSLSDSARAAKDASAALTSLYTAWSKFADSNLATPIRAVASALDTLGSEGADTAMSVLGYGAAGLGALVMARKAYTGVRSLFGRGGGLAGAAGAAGLGGMKLPLPVYVVNSKMSLLPGEMGGGSTKTGRSVASRGARLSGAISGAGKWAGRAGGALALAGTGYGLYNAWTDDELSTGQKIQASGGAVGSGLGGWGGAVAGAQLGAALGSIVPGLGTAIGAAVGGIGGGLAGAWAGGNVGDRLGELLSQWTGAEPAKATLDITVTDDRVKVSRVNQRGFDNVDVDTGPYMPGVGR